MKWFITGGAGFIGQNLVNTLLKYDNEVTVYDNFSVGKRENVHSDASIIKGDILDAKKLLSSSKDHDIMIHLAAQTSVPESINNPLKDFHNNVIGAYHCLEVCRFNGISKFVFASSSAPAGITPPPINEEKPSRPMSPYGASKLAGEGYCSAFYHSFGLNTVALRFSNVYGELSEGKTSVIAKWIERIMDEEPVEVYGDGDQTRDFIYVGDLVDAIIKSAITPALGGEVFQIATGIETSLNHILQIFTDNIEEMFPIEYGDEQKGDIKNNWCDITKARTLIKWEPVMPLEEGIRKTIEWFSEN